ncbi:MAG: hypothetical protein LC772_04835, partial [Chloroflexi bacterium]|nr:hypothetical protein [Chloroflexota bacterium]
TSSLLLGQPQIRIDGNEATVQVYATLTASPASAGGAAGGGPSAAGAPAEGPPTTVYQGSVTMQLQREDTRRFGIFPTHEWRLVKAQIPNLESVEGF